MNNLKELADLMFPNVLETVADLEAKYPERNIPEGAEVTRFAPSPTGFVHMGSLLSAFQDFKAARDTNGIFYLRIEDTDTERSVENGISGIIKDLANFDIVPDEGVMGEDEQKGEYGPYIQSERKHIYHVFAKDLVEKGLAYPCFCSKEDLDETREIQELNKERIGYYGSYAKCRSLTVEEAIEKIKNGEKYVVRFKSPGNFNNRITLDDRMRGKIEFPENDLDIVIIKSTDGLPTYHFAHAVDDHLMHTTTVMRGEEWIPSYPIHHQLFETMGFKEPRYAHLGLVMKIDENGTRRKLSKRKDPEASVEFYHQKGIPSEATKLYLMTIANSNFEEWLSNNPDGKLDDFKMDFSKMSESGTLFDVEKLFNITKNYISRMTSEELYDEALPWMKEFDEELYHLMRNYPEYTKKIFSIERYQEKPRKDYSSFSDIRNGIWYMYDELFYNLVYEYGKITDRNEIRTILNTYFTKYYDINDDKDTWFNKVKLLCDELGYASNMKDYKANPDAYKGNVADISTVIRVSVTTRCQTPDLYEILKLLGIDRINKRINMI
jgi:glutamyl-tRNA synthetase